MFKNSNILSNHMTSVIVTRNGQITISKEIRDELGIREGDYVSLNVVNHAILVSKKNPAVFDNFNSFLPENFEQVLKGLRSGTYKRLRKLGITQG